MFLLSADLKVFLHREPIDFRTGINSLAVLVQGKHSPKAAVSGLLSRPAFPFRSQSLDVFAEISCIDLAGVVV